MPNQRNSKASNAKSDEELELMQAPEDENVINTLDAIWFICDEIMHRNIQNGNTKYWLKGRYQSVRGGAPKEVIHVWGLEMRDMRKIYNFSRANPLKLVSLIGDFSVRQNAYPYQMTGRNEIHTLSNALIEIENSEWVIQTLDRNRVVRTRFAPRSTESNAAKGS